MTCSSIFFARFSFQCNSSYEPPPPPVDSPCFLPKFTDSKTKNFFESQLLHVDATLRATFRRIASSHTLFYPTWENLTFSVAPFFFCHACFRNQRFSSCIFFPPALCKGTCFFRPASLPRAPFNPFCARFFLTINRFFSLFEKFYPLSGCDVSFPTSSLALSSRIPFFCLFGRFLRKRLPLVPPSRLISSRPFFPAAFSKLLN